MTNRLARTFDVLTHNILSLSLSVDTPPTVSTPPKFEFQSCLTRFRRRATTRFAVARTTAVDSTARADRAIFLSSAAVGQFFACNLRGAAEAAGFVSRAIDPFFARDSAPSSLGPTRNPPPLRSRWRRWRRRRIRAFNLAGSTRRDTRARSRGTGGGGRANRAFRGKLSLSSQPYPSPLPLPAARPALLLRALTVPPRPPRAATGTRIPSRAWR